jgi:hypothetical protein
MIGASQARGPVVLTLANPQTGDESLIRCGFPFF